MRLSLWAASFAVLAGCAGAPDALDAKGSQFLFVWSGDKDKVESDFLSVVDLREGSATYGDVVATAPIGTISPLAYILVLYAMQTAPISSVAPMRELSMVFAAFFGAKLLGEGHRGERLIGATLMALGVWGLMHG